MGFCLTRYVLSCGRFYCFICETLISDDYNSSRSRDDGGIILKTRVLALPPWTKFTSIGSIGGKAETFPRRTRMADGIYRSEYTPGIFPDDGSFPFVLLQRVRTLKGNE